MNSTLRSRIISAVIGIVVIVTLLTLKGWFVVVPAAILALIGVYEFHRAFKNIGYLPLLVGGWTLTALAIGAYISGPSQWGLYAMLALMLFFGMLAYHVFTNHSIVDVLITVFSVVYVAIPFIIMMALGNRSDRLLWVVFVVAFASDSFAYFAGKAFGKRKLIEAVSPNKTVEGAIGGVLGCLLGVIIFKLWIMPELPWAFVAILGTLGSVASQIGDLTASKIKRHCKIKDFGNVIPGHGGVLDRFDSILFTVPVVYMAAWLMAF